MRTKFFITILMFALIANASAQLKVSSDGKAGFGNNLASNNGIYLWDNSGSNNYSPTPFHIYRDANNMIAFSRGTQSNGSGIMLGHSGAVGIGYNLNSQNSNHLLSSQDALLVQTPSSGLPATGIKVQMNANQGGSGVYVISPYAYNLRPFYANNGLRDIFYVDDNGSVWSYSGYTTSDLSLKKNIEAIKSPLEKVMQLQGISFNYNFPEMDDIKNVDLESLFENSKQRTPELTREIFDQIQKEKSRKQLGVIAQEVEKVLPELVRTREDGTKAVAYSEMVAVLIEAIKEQQNQIEELKSEIEKIKDVSASDASFRSANSATGMTGVDQTLAQCKLYQNSPNPFKEKTEIRYYIPTEVQSAEIFLFNLQGNLLKKIPAPHSGLVEIKGNHFHAGMYIYTLVADGQPIDTKRMILTK